MDTNTHYLKIGIFVLIFSSLLVIGLLWLSVGFNSQGYKLYQVMMQESVTGLSVKAPVKYNGVDVGYVATIDLPPKDPRKVRLLLAIEDDIPIYKGTAARLQSQGLTGISFINLRGGNPRLPLIKAKKDQKYPEIPSSPSLFLQLDTAIEHISTNINVMSARVKQVLSTQNVNAISDTLQNLDHFSQTLNRNSGNIDNILRTTAQATKQLPQVMNSVADTAKQLNAAGLAAKAAVENVNNQVLPQLTQTLNSVQTAADSIGGLASELQQNPSMLLRGKTPPPKGPGE